MICENCDQPIGDDEGYRHEGLGVVHKYCPEDE